MPDRANSRPLTNNEVIEVSQMPYVGEVIYTVRGPKKKKIFEQEVTLSYEGERSGKAVVRVADHITDGFLVSRNNEPFETTATFKGKRGKCTLRVNAFWKSYWKSWGKKTALVI